MRKSIYFDDDISKETINDLIQEIHTEESNIDLFFSTKGGISSVMNCFVHYANQLPSDKLTIYFTEQVMSAGVSLMRDYKGKKVVHSDLDLIMIHAPDRLSYSIRDSKEGDKILKQDKKVVKVEANRFKEFLGLSDKQHKEYLRGEDIYIYKKDFHKINLNYNEIQQPKGNK